VIYDSADYVTVKIITLCCCLYCNNFRKVVYTPAYTPM